MESFEKALDIISKGSTLSVITLFVVALLFLAYKLSLFKTNKERLSDTVIDASSEMVANLRASYDNQYSLLLNRITAMDATILELRDVWHKSQVRNTRQQVLLIQFKGLCADKAIELPKYMADELADLLGEQ